MGNASIWNRGNYHRVVKKKKLKKRIYVLLHISE